MKFVAKHCLFCRGDEDIEELYPRTFADADLTPELFSARGVATHLHYVIARCRRCGLVFSREILPDDVLERLYAGSFVTFHAYTQILRRDYWRPLASYAETGPKDSAMEIGCSNGFFLDELLARGYREVYGCEPSLEAKAMAHPLVSPNIRTELFRADLFAPASFDLVCSFHTLDHVSDPVAVVNATHKVLRPRGLAYFITHNINALQARVLGERSPIIDVEHIYLFNPATLRRLFASAGFEVLEVGNVVNSYPLEYWVKMTPSRSGIKRIISAALTATRAGRIPFPLKAGNIYVIARKSSDVRPAAPGE